MKTEIGEYAVGAYLEVVKGCEVVTYNVKPQEKGRNGQTELDVVAFDLKNNIAYLCEVTTHLGGLGYGDTKEDTIHKIMDKYDRQKAYADKYLKTFSKIHYMFWSPVVRPAYLDILNKNRDDELELVINGIYAEKIKELEEKAEDGTRDIGNPFFRTLQILKHLRYKN
jgi:hypothetical protein